MADSKCVFCNFDDSRIIERSEFCFAAYFDCAIKKGHIVIAVKEFVTSLSKLKPEQAADLMRLAVQVAAKAERLIGNEKYYLVSIADETPHYHIHLLPKMKDDVPIGSHIMSDSGWKGSVGDPPVSDDITDFISEYRNHDIV